MDHSKRWSNRRMPPEHGWWQSLRNTVYERDGKRCRKCGATRSLTVDHKLPLRAGGTNKLSNLQILCWTCHANKTEWEEQNIRTNRYAKGPIRDPIGPSKIRPPRGGDDTMMQEESTGEVGTSEEPTSTGDQPESTPDSGQNEATDQPESEQQDSGETDQENTGEREETAEGEQQNS